MGVFMAVSRGRDRAARRRRGTTLVEAAIVLPLLLLVIFGLIEYGSMFLRLQQVANVARQAARRAATPDATPGEVTGLITTMMTSAGLGGSEYVATVSPADPGDAERGGQVSVKIEITYSKIAITNAPLIPVPAKIARTVVMAKEGP
jgi:Flp pilus assembly protein TadG